MKITQCPQCGGKVRSESIGWTCESCQGFIDMQGGFQPHIGGNGPEVQKDGETD